MMLDGCDQDQNQLCRPVCCTGKSIIPECKQEALQVIARAHDTSPLQRALCL